MKILMDGIRRFDHEYFDSFFIAIEMMLNMEDSVSEERVDYFLSNFIVNLEADQSYVDATRRCIQFLMHLCQHNHRVSRWMSKRRSVWLWLEEASQMYSLKTLLSQDS